MHIFCSDAWSYFPFLLALFLFFQLVHKIHHLHAIIDIINAFELFLNTSSGSTIIKCVLLRRSFEKCVLVRLEVVTRALCVLSSHCDNMYLILLQFLPCVRTQDCGLFNNGEPFSKHISDFGQSF